MIKYTFSGHDSFHCKDLWLKKGYDFIIAEKNFNEESAVVDLGVGKNMVSAIKYWLRAFSIIDDQMLPNNWANKIFSENGYDPYIENSGTLWILHYKLISTQFASIYNLTFSDFQKEYREFTPEQLLIYLKRNCSSEEMLYSFNENTVKRDINVLFKNYVKPLEDEKSIEDFSSLLIDLNLIYNSNSEHRRFRFGYETKSDIAPEIALFIILDKFGTDKVIDFHALANLFFSFCITADMLVQIIEDIKEKYPEIVFSDDAGIRQIQLRSNIDQWQILDNYYNSTNN